MYVDASPSCNTALFNWGSQAFARQYDIKITQYNCQDEQGGPPGCLQYFTGNTGTFSSFNFQTTKNAVTSSVTHLSNQCYSICFRRNQNKCALCVAPTINPAGASNVADQASFGLSASTPGTAENDVTCSTDYLVIPNGQAFGAAVIAMTNVVVGDGSRFCGRYLNKITQAMNGVSICTFTRPFRIAFKTDANEVVGIAATGTNEQTGAPGGIIGFQLSFNQISC